MWILEMGGYQPRVNTWNMRLSASCELLKCEAINPMWTIWNARRSASRWNSSLKPFDLLHLEVNPKPMMAWYIQWQIIPKYHNENPQSRHLNQLLIKKRRENKFKETLASNNGLNHVAGGGQQGRTWRITPSTRRWSSQSHSWWIRKEIQKKLKENQRKIWNSFGFSWWRRKWMRGRKWGI